MRKKILLGVLTLGLFYGSAIAKDSNVITGTYGGCNQENPIVQLVLNEDHSFHYVDHSNPSQDINVNGTWEVKNNKVVLMDDSGLDFHHKWKISDEGKVAKSRKGLNFYRLPKSTS